MKKKILASMALLAIIGLTTAGLVTAADMKPFLGTWVLVPAKSKSHGKPLTQSQTMVVTDEGNGMTHYAITWVDGAGTAGEVEYSLKADDKVYPATKNKDFDGAKETFVSSRKIKWFNTKDGKTVVSGDDTVSEDGKTLFETEAGTVDGKPYRFDLVYTRK